MVLACALLTGFPGPVAAKVDLDNSASASSVGKVFSLTISSFTTTGTATDGYLLVGVALNDNGAPDVDTVTFDGTGLTELGVQTNGNVRVEIWGLADPAAATGDVVIDLDNGASNSEIVAGVASFTDVDSAIVDTGSFFGATGNDTRPIVTVCPGGTDCPMVSGDALFSALATRGNANAISPDGLIRFDSTAEQFDNNTDNVSSITQTQAIAAGENRKLIVGVVAEDDDGAIGTISVDYGGQALTSIVSVDEADGAGNNDIIRVQTFYLDEAGIAAAADSDWTISVASNVDVLIGGGIAIEYARQGDPEANATSSLDDGTATITTNITTIANDAWLIDTVGSDRRRNFAPGTGQTERVDRNAGNPQATEAMSDKEVTTPALDSMSQTYNIANPHNKLAHTVISVSPFCPGCELWDTRTGTAGGEAYGGGAVRGAEGNAVDYGWTMARSRRWATGAVLLKQKTINSTQATIGGVRAYADVGGATIEWGTTSEHGTVGFNLLRLDEPSETYRRVNDRLLPARNGGTYRYVDRAAEVGERYTYLIEEIEATGETRSYGPYALTVAAGPPRRDPTELPDPSIDYERIERALSAIERQRIATRKRARAESAKRRARRSGPRLKIAVRDDGLHYVAAADIARLMARPRNRVRGWIRANNLRLSHRGRPIAWRPGAGAAGLYFYGEGIESPYTADNIYWLWWGEGLQMRARPAGSASPVRGAQAFTATARAEGNQYALTHLFDDPDADYWVWDYILAGPGSGKDFPISSPGAVGEPATLSVSLHGASDLAEAVDHHATIAVNGVPIGAARWPGLKRHTARLPVPAGLLEDENIITVGGVLEEGVPFSIFYVDDFSLEYRRNYHAEGAELALASEEHRRITVRGIAGRNRWVLDVTRPQRPVLLRDPVVSPDSGRHAITFCPAARRGGHCAAKPAGRFVVVDPAAARIPASMSADHYAGLRQRGRAVDYLVITATGLLEPAGDLARYRRGQGLRTLVVDVEDIFDEFNHGMRDPDAIWRFLRYAHRQWATAPRYVVIAGEGSIDYKDYLGFGDALVPSVLVPTPHGLAPSDNVYADVEGNDRLAEFAIGRLPVIDAAELAAMVAKIVDYEASGGDWTERLAIAVDPPDAAAGDFERSALMMSEQVPEHFAIDWIRVADDGATLARQRLHDALQDGRAFVSFVGHGGFFGLGNTDPQLLTADDVAGIDNQDRLPVITALTCLAGQFGFQGLDTLGESLVVHPTRGAIALWAPSGQGMNRSAAVLGEHFYRTTFDDGELVIGEVILKTQRAFAETGTDRYLLDLYNLLGDPALIMK